MFRYHHSCNTKYDIISNDTYIHLEYFGTFNWPYPYGPFINLKGQRSHMSIWKTQIILTIMIVKIIIKRSQLNTMAWFSRNSSCRSLRLFEAPRILWDFVDRSDDPWTCGGSVDVDWCDPTLVIPNGEFMSGCPRSGRCTTGAGAETTDKPCGPWWDGTLGRSEMKERSHIRSN